MKWALLAMEGGRLTGRLMLEGPVGPASDAASKPQIRTGPSSSGFRPTGLSCRKPPIRASQLLRPKQSWVGHYTFETAGLAGRMSFHSAQTLLSDETWGELQ